MKRYDDVCMEERIAHLENMVRKLTLIIEYHGHNMLRHNHVKRFPSKDESPFFEAPGFKIDSALYIDFLKDSPFDEPLVPPNCPIAFEDAKNRMKQYASFKDTTMVPIFELMESQEALGKEVKTGETFDSKEAYDWEKQGKNLPSPNPDPEFPDWGFPSRKVYIRYRRIPKPQT